jgi:hypothetical protein
VYEDFLPLARDLTYYAQERRQTFHGVLLRNFEIFFSPKKSKGKLPSTKFSEIFVQAILPMSEALCLKFEIKTMG